jgi:hypothetical protein
VNCPTNYVAAAPAAAAPLSILEPLSVL